MPRNEALLETVLKRARTTRHSWLTARDANMCPEDFEKSLWFQRETMHVVPRREYPRAGRKVQKMCGSKERMTISLRVVVSKVKSYKWRWLKIFEPKPHEAVSFVVSREKEIKEWSEEKLPEVLPGYSGERLPGRSTKEKGREEGEVDEAGEERRIRGPNRPRSGCRHQKKVSVQSFMRSWDCSHVENEEEEESGREGDQTAAQWEEGRNWRRLWNNEGLKETP